MKRHTIAAALIALVAGVATAQAAPGKHSGYHGKSHGVSKVYNKRKSVRRGLQRKRIALSRIRLAKLKRRVRADGRVTRHERRLVRAAQKRLNTLRSNGRRH